MCREDECIAATGEQQATASMSYVPPHRRGRDASSSGKSGSLNGGPRSRGSRAAGLLKAVATLDQIRADAETSLFANAFTYVRCINLKGRTEQWERFLYHAGRMGPQFLRRVERFEAIDGKAAVASDQKEWLGKDVALEWDTTQNSRWDRHVTPGETRHLTPGEIGCALSHVALWQELAMSTEIVDGADDLNTTNPRHTSMLILEDDATLLHPERGGNFRDCNPEKPLSAVRFRIAFRKAWDLIPADWDIFYLGFSDRGERRELLRSESSGVDNVTIELFKPEYGFHTHAYAIKPSAARVLLDNLPVVGPIDVWLADNAWFDLRVYSAKVKGDGYKNLGANLICQNRVDESSIPQSGRGRG